MNTILLVLALATAPYQSIVQPNGTSANYFVDCGDPNRGLEGEFVYEATPTIGVPGTFRTSIIDNSAHHGWNGVGYKTGGDGMPPKVWPLNLSGAWQPAYTAQWSGLAFGNFDSQGSNWPNVNGAITVQSNNSTMMVDSTGSPCEGLRVFGAGNKVIVDVRQGAQSRYLLGRPAVYIEGNDMTLTGVIDATTMAGVVVRGDRVRLGTSTTPLVVYAGSVGDDIGAIYLQGYERDATGKKILAVHKYATIENVIVIQTGRRYWPLKPWKIVAVYADDGYSNVTIKNLTVIGQWTHGVFSHGGNYVTINGLTCIGAVGKAHEFAPHFTATSTQPIGCKATGVTKL